jgi:hypothetical protein
MDVLSGLRYRVATGDHTISRVCTHHPPRERNMRRRFAFLWVASLAAILPGAASAQIVGTGAGGGNLFPFGGPPSLSIYQQIYTASNFAGPGLLQSVKFFRGTVAGVIRPGTYDVYVSTTSVGVNGLSNVDFDGNRGGNNALFGSYALSGFPGAELTFVGSPFFYDPSAGNLLLDIRISGAGTMGGANFRANGDALGVFSRTFDAPGGLGFQGWGLQTGFVFVSTVPEPSTSLLIVAGILVIFSMHRRGIARALASSPPS